MIELIYLFKTVLCLCTIAAAFYMGKAFEDDRYKRDYMMVSFCYWVIVVILLYKTT